MQETGRFLLLINLDSAITLRPREEIDVRRLSIGAGQVSIQMCRTLGYPSVSYTYEGQKRCAGTPLPPLPRGASLDTSKPGGHNN